MKLLLKENVVKNYLFFGVLFATFSFCFPAKAANQVVTSNADSGAGSLRQAVTDVGDNEEITFNLSAGNETISLSSEINIDLYPRKTFTIDGDNTAGSGTDVTVQVASPGVSTYRVFYIEPGTGEVITLKNMTVRGGDVHTQEAGYRDGGAIKAEWYGGVTLDNVTITDGVATRGGAIYVYYLDGPLTINNCNINNNSAIYYNFGGNGAGLFVRDATVTISNTIVDSNDLSYYSSSSAGMSGGGMYSYSNDLTITNSTFSNNSSTYGSGGGISDSGGSTLTVENSTFYNNSTSSGSGGGLLVSDANSIVEITNSTFSNNYSSGPGGGLYLRGTVAVTNSTIANNDTSGGYSADGLHSACFNGYLTIKNTILANNSGYDFAQTYSGGPTDNGYNIIENSYNYVWEGTGDITGNQANLNLSSSLADNSTLYGTQTLALSSGSVAINAGDSAANGTVSVPGRDQRGAYRNGTVDIGAYEYDGPFTDNVPPTILSVSSDKAVGYYTVGEVIDIDVTFSEPVTSSGDVVVTLETGSVDRTCSFSVSSSSTGSCNYTVQSGDTSSDLDIVSISGTIADDASNAMTNFTPVTSLADNEAIVIDTTSPSDPVASPVAGTYVTSQSVSLSSTGSSAIYYTTDGTTPTVSSTLYSSAITVNSSQDIKVLAVDQAGNESSVETFSYTIDLDLVDPTFSNISNSTDSDSAEITWVTNEEASSQVEYGLTSSFGSQTSETDTSTKVTNHTVNLNTLKSCAKYYFRVKSKDINNNQGVSSANYFYTKGCEVSSLTDGESSNIGTSGGSVSLDVEDGEAVLEAPENYLSQSAVIQINKLDKDQISGSPVGLSLVKDNIFSFLAVLSDETVYESDFDEPITLTISYNSETEDEFEEDTLDLYKYISGDWEPKNCTLDTSANTLTCTLSSFSSYGVFGEEAEDDSEDYDVEIKKLEYSVGKDSIIVKWKTDDKADSRVRFGFSSTTMDNKKKDNKDEKKHKIVLDNLMSDTQYFFRAYSDREGFRDYSKIYSAKTLSADKDEPVIFEEEFLDNYDGEAKAKVCSYIVQEGDSLWSIAKDIFGDATAYPLIVEKNKDKYPEIAVGELSIDQELVFDCENQNSRESDKGTSSLVDKKSQKPETDEDENKNWWNPFSWF